MRISSYVSAASLFTLLLPSPAPAETAGMVLGHAGQLHRGLTGTYGELFADLGDGADTAVLAVETLTSGSEASRLLVPGTLDSRIESGPRLFQDPHRDAFVMLWRSQGEDGGRLDFATFDGAEWSEVFTLEQDGAPVALAAEPLIAESHDAFELEVAEGEPIRLERRILHLLWRGGEPAVTYYAPLFFVEGGYIGRHSLFALDERFLLAPEPPPDEAAESEEPATGTPAFELTADLARTLDLRPAGDGAAVLVTFANPATHRLGTLEVRPLPLALGLLGEQVREQVFAHADLYDPDDLSVFSDGMRAAIVITGHTFKLHDAHATYVADQVADWILASQGTYDWSDLELLGDGARDLAVDAGREVYASTAADPADASEIVRVNVAGLLDGAEPDLAEVLDFRVRCDLPAPGVGDGAVTVHPSRQGDALLVAWEDAKSGQIRWVESSHGAWSETFSLTVGESLPAATAHELLARRIR